MKNVQLKLAVGDTAVHVLRETVPTGPGVHVFELCHQPAQFGDIALKQYWIDKRTIYPQRSRAVNYQPLINFWWCFCQRDGGLLDNKSCETYLLASLLMDVRSNGSRRVVNDSVPRRQMHAKRDELVQALESMLISTKGQEISIPDFSQFTADIIGPIGYHGDVATQTGEFTGELFGHSVPQLQSGNESEAIERARRVWAQWQNRFGRRAGHPAEKLIMDILSYEARAAIHRCYSFLWSVIPNCLETDGQNANASAVYHRFWHRDLIWHSNEFTDHHFRLFHGHVFALHPSTSFFAQTKTGRQLIGDWLQIAGPDWQYTGNPETPELKRLLYGIYIAVWDYRQRHQSESDSRKNRISQIPEALEDRDIIQGEGSPAKFMSFARRGEKAPD